MAQLNLNPKFIETLQRTAGARIAREVTQSLSGTTIQRIQQILQATDFVDGALGLSGEFSTQAQPLLGGVTMEYAKNVYAQLGAARLARKNLFVIQIDDITRPDLGYVQRPPDTTRSSSSIGEIINTGRRVLGGGLGGPISDGIGALAGRGQAAGPDSGLPTGSGMFNLFATTVSYSPETMLGEKIPFGSANMDKLTGTESTELQITTMDDEAGTLKRWFEGKCGQAARKDGTFGLPSEYLVNIAIYHAVVKPDDRAFKFHAKMRPASIQYDLSRSEQALQEIQMSFSQFDSFLPV